MILRFRVAEVDRVGSQHVGLQREPGWVCQATTSFDYSPHAAGPSHGEAELAVLETKGVGSQNSWAPKGGGTTSASGTPAKRARQVIDRDLTIKDIITKAASVSLDIHSCETWAIGKRLPSDAVDASGDRDAGQVGAPGKRPSSDAGHSGGNREVGQAPAAMKHVVLDGANAGAEGEVAHAGAVAEGSVPDTGHAVGDGDAYQAGAARERLGSDARNRVSERGIGQVKAAVKRRVPDGEDPIGDRDASQATELECRGPDLCNAVGDAVLAPLSRRPLDERSQRFIEQDSACTRIGGVE